MADLVVTTDFTQVNNLNTALKSTDTIFVKAVDSVVRESNRFNRITKFLAKTTEQTLKVVEKAEQIAAAKIQQESLKREKTRIREAAAAEREAKRIEAANKRVADSEAKLAAEVAKNRAISAQQFTSGVNQRTGVTGSSAMQSGASFSAMDQEIERLRQKYDKIYSASRLYEQQLEELNRAHMLGVTSVKQHEAAIESLNVEYQQFSNAAEGAFLANNRFSQHINQTGRGLNNFGFVAQQVGYQVGDFFVQVQSGTNVLVAFGQQATQLAGLIPGVWGAAIGIGISVATALGSAWMRTTEDVKKGADEQKAALESLTDTVKNLRLERQMDMSGAQSQGEQTVLNEINSLIRERNALQSQTLNLTSQEMIIASGGRSQVAADYLEDQMAIRQVRIDEINLILKQLEYERQLEIAARLRANEVRNQYREQFKEAERFKTKVFETLGVMESMAKVNLSNAFTNAMPAANGLLQTVTDLYNKAVGLAYISSNSPGGKSYLANQYALYGAGKEMSKQTVAEAGSLYTPFKVPEASSGGTSTRETKLRKEISLVKELTQAEKDRQTVLQSVESSLEDGFMSMVDGTKSVTDAFKSMARDIIKELYRVFVVQRMVGGISSAFGPLTGASTGSLGLPFGRASGGSVMGNTPYLVGEHGPELVIPRHSGSVVNANQTANALGNGSGNFTQNLTISVTGSDSAMVRAEVAKMIPQITNATKAAVIDAKQRGGQMAAAFR